MAIAEIYNEYIYDMLEKPPGAKEKRRNTYKLKQDREGDVYIKGAVPLRHTTSDLSPGACGQ